MAGGPEGVAFVRVLGPVQVVTSSGAVVDLPSSGGVVLTGRLSGATHAWLRDHAVGGVVMLLAARSYPHDVAFVVAEARRRRGS